MAKNKLFQKVIGDTLLLSDRQQISRDIPIVNRRNLIMISRYYVYVVLMQITPETAISAMKCEFYLKEKTIKKIIASREPEFKTMCDAKRTIEWFKAEKDWDHLDWDYDPTKPIE